MSNNIVYEMRKGLMDIIAAPTQSPTHQQSTNQDRMRNLSQLQFEMIFSVIKKFQTVVIVCPHINLIFDV